MIGFPTGVLLSEEECYRYLKRSLHPERLSCRRYELPDEQAPHDRHRAPIMDYRCRECGAVFKIFIVTVWSNTHYDCWATRDASAWVCEGGSDQAPGRRDGLGLSVGAEAAPPHSESASARRAGRAPGEAPEDGLTDPEVEADEMYQNAGKRKAVLKSR